MADKESQAHEYVRKRNWSRAITIYDQLLAPATVNFKIPKDRIVACLLGRCECLLELGRYENCIADAKRVLKMLCDQTDYAASIARVRRRLVHSLYKLKRFQEAEISTKEWISEASSQPSFSDISKTLERYKTVIQMANGQKTNQRISIQRLDDEMATLDTKLEHWSSNNLPLDKFSKLLTTKGMKKRDNGNGNGSTPQKSLITDQLGNLKLTEASENLDGTVTCSYCTISFQDKNELRQHCQTETHQNVIMSDEGRDWKWRPPPRGYTIDSYTLCESFSESQSCHYGNQCVEAHGMDELSEWKDRFEYRKMRLQRACEKELYGKSYTEELLEKWVQATSPDKIMREKVDGIEEQCSNELVTTISSKVSKREWVFIFKTKLLLKAVALLQDAHRHYFSVKSITPGDLKTSSSINNAGTTTNNSTGTGANSNNNNKTKPSTTTTSSTATTNSNSTSSNNSNTSINSSKQIDLDSKSDQEWVSYTFDRTYQPTADSPILEHKIKIAFTTDIYGTFRQSVCFDFGTDPVLVKHLCVDVVPVGDAEKIQEIKKDIISSASTRWDDSNSNLIKFETTIGSHLKTEAFLNDIKREKDLLERYPCPRAATFSLTQSTIVEKRLTKNNYRSRIHELLYVEEIARYEQIARFNLSTKLRIASNYMLTPSGMATSTAKYSHSGELFGLMSLGKDISEDTSAGRLILSNCSSVYLSETVKGDDKSSASKTRDVYESMIEDKGKNMIYLKLAAKCVQGLNLKPETDFQVDIQFQLNRLSYCEWHNAVDKIADFRIIFPDTFIEPNIPWTPKKQWSDACDPKLNTKQKEAINAITTPINCHLPPILLIGPFGTGKTYTLAQAIKQLLTQPDARILICTHSNSAADLYIKEYLHPWVEKGISDAIPLRVYYHKRWVATVNSVVQKYCIIDGNGNFRRPSVEDIFKHRIVVVTLSISMELASLELPKGYFTHIFLDEAAQAMECEAIMPLALASENTRIVLAGDHMQMSPELFSNFAKERRLHISLLERLYDHYPSNFPCKILLCENYRAHEAIIKFTSELFYEQKLIASGKQPKHEKFYPLTFFTTRGEDVQDKNSTAFYNNSEVYEVVERVCELRKKWPSSWGKINDQSIGIMTPYADQVFRIRSELRKRRMGGISVERVLNVQGKQFRAIFLSTVRTRRTCTPNNNTTVGTQNDDTDYGFLSNSKLLNTAITRAQSLVAVVGDPVALCSIGRCRKVWERFIDICNQNKSLFGITWSYLRSQLDGVELKRSYVLNPLAPEFIPRSLQPESYLRKQQAMIPATAQQQPVPPTPQSNVHVPPAYANHGYGMLNQQVVAPQMVPQVQSTAHQGSMPIRPIGPPNQVYNLGGPPQVASNQQQYSPYLVWPQQQQQPASIIRPNYAGPPPQPPGNQHVGATLNSNPNASLWGPPPQSNPWGVLPKSVVNPNMRPTTQPQPQQQPPINLNMNNMNIRPPAPAAPPLPQQQIQSMRSPQDLAYLSKYVYQTTNNYNNQNHVVLNQLNMRNQLHNGPASPATAGTAPAANPHDVLSTMQRSGHVQNPASLPHTYIGPHQQSALLKEKEIQFLNNVHNIPSNNTSGPQGALMPAQASLSSNAASSALQQPHHPDYNPLLPINMTFYEMALEPKEIQYKWYLRLMEVNGQEAANKFTEILRQVMVSAHAHTTGGSTAAIAGTNKNILGQQNTQLQAQTGRSINSTSGQTTSAVPSENTNINFNQQIDLVFNSLMNGNEMSQPILRDLLGMVSSTTNNSNSINIINKEHHQQQLQHHQLHVQHQQQQQQQRAQQQQQQQQAQQQNNYHNAPLFNAVNDITLSSRVESVPLYRRQVVGSNGSNSGGGYHSSTPSSSNTQSIASSTPDHMLDNNTAAGIVNPASSMLMETLFTANEMSPYANVNSMQKLFYSYQLKQNNDNDLLTNQCAGIPMHQNHHQQQPQTQVQHSQSQQHQPIHHQQQQAPHHQQQQQQQQTPASTSTNNTTYASVLSQGNVPQQPPTTQHHHQQHNSHLACHPNNSHGHMNHGGSYDDKDPFAAIRELGQRSNGYYNYFQ